MAKYKAGDKVRVEARDDRRAFVFEARNVMLGAYSGVTKYDDGHVVDPDGWEIKYIDQWAVLVSPVVDQPDEEEDTRSEFDKGYDAGLYEAEHRQAQQVQGVAAFAVLSKGGGFIEAHAIKADATEAAKVVDGIVRPVRVVPADVPAASDPWDAAVAMYNKGLEEGAAVERAKQADAAAVETVDVWRHDTWQTESGTPLVSSADPGEHPDWVKGTASFQLPSPVEKTTPEQVLLDAMTGLGWTDAAIQNRFELVDALRAAGLIPREGDQ